MEYLRGFVTGIGFLFVVEVLVVLVVCFILFDPLRKTTTPPPSAYSASATPGGSSSSSSGGSGAKDAKDRKPPGSIASATFRKATDPSNEHDEPWPGSIVEFLRNALTPGESDTTLPPAPAPAKVGRSKDGSSTSTGAEEPSPVLDPVAMGPTQPCDWANVVLHRFFLSLRDSQLFKDRMRARTTERMNMKLQNNSFVSHVNILDISLGENVPVVHGLRLLKGVTDDLAVFLEIDVNYNGGGSVAIETTLTAGLSVPVRVYLSGFTGKLRVRCPSSFWQDMLAVAFVSDPGIQFIVDSPITVRDNEMVRGVVNRLLAGILRKVFLEMWVLPSWRYFFLPLMIPSPMEEMTRMIAANSKNPGAAFVRPAKSLVAGRTPTLWESRSALLRSATVSTMSSVSNGVKILDVVGARAFPISAVILPGTDLDGFEESLVSSFLALATRNGVLPQNNDLASGNASSDADSVTEDVAKNAGAMLATGSNLLWKTVRNRNGVHVQRSRHNTAGATGDVMRAIININCDAERVYAFLSNPEHYRFIEDGFSYIDSSTIKSFDESRSVRRSSFAIPKQTKEFSVFEVRRKLSQSRTDFLEKHKDKAGSEAFVVVLRSVAGFSDHPPESPPEITNQSLLPMQSGPKEPSVLPTVSSSTVSGYTEPTRRIRTTSENTALKDVISSSPPTSSPFKPVVSPPPISPSSVMIFGYLIEPDIGPPSSCTVTVISQLSSDLGRLEVAYGWCRKIKTVVEEIVSRTNGPLTTAVSQAAGNELRRRRIFGGGSVSSTSENFTAPGEKRIEKIKNLVTSGAAYLMKNRKVAGWLGRDANGAAVGSTGAEISTPVSSIDREEMEEIAETLAQVEMARLDEIEMGEDVFIPMISEDEQDSDFASDFGSDKGAVNQQRRGTNFDNDSVMESEYSDGVQASEGVLRAGTAPNVPPRPRIQGETTVSPSTPAFHSTSASMVSNLSGMVPDNIKASAVAIARSVTKRRSFGFLKRGSDSNLNSDDDDESGGDPLLDSSFAVGMNFSHQPFVEQRIPIKDVARVEVPFAGAFRDPVEVAWEFLIRSDQNVMFGLIFKPDVSSASHSTVDGPLLGSNYLSTLFPESVAERGVRQLLPMANVHSTPGRSFRGSLCISSFPPGKLIFLFDNTSGKKVPRDIAHRISVRAFQLPKSISMTASALLGENVGEFGLGTKPGGYCSGVVGEVVVQRKAVYRTSVVYDPVMDGQDDSNMMTYLTWDFTTNGMDVVFGVYYTKVNDSLLAAKALLPLEMAFESESSALPVGSLSMSRLDSFGSVDSIHDDYDFEHYTEDNSGLKVDNSGSQKIVSSDMSNRAADHDLLSFADVAGPVEAIQRDRDGDSGSDLTAFASYEHLPDASAIVQQLNETATDGPMLRPEIDGGSTRGSVDTAPTLPPRGQSLTSSNNISTPDVLPSHESVTPPPKPARASVGSKNTAAPSPPKPARRAPPTPTLSASAGAERPTLASRLAGVVSRDAVANPNSSPLLTPSSSSVSSSPEGTASSVVSPPSNAISIPAPNNAPPLPPPRPLSPAAATSPLATSPVHSYDPFTAKMTTTISNSLAPHASPTASPVPLPAVRLSGLSGAVGGTSTTSLRHHDRPEAVVPPSRVSSHRGSNLTGAIAISGRRGLYSFVWDNSHSMVLHKTIAFRVGTVTTVEDEVTVTAISGFPGEEADALHTPF